MENGGGQQQEPQGGPQQQQQQGEQLPNGNHGVEQQQAAVAQGKLKHAAKEKARKLKNKQNRQQRR